MDERNGETRKNLGELPRGWVWTTLGEIQRDQSHSVEPSKTPDQIFELYSVTHFSEGKPEIISGKEIGSNKRAVEEGTVLLCGINPRINRVWVVHSYSPHPKIASTEWRPFFKREEVYPEYLCYFLQNNQFRDFLAANASGVGGSLMRVQSRIFASYPFPLSPMPEQHRIVTELEELFSDLDAGVAALEKTKAQLKRYRQAVLKAAVEGKLTAEWRAANAGNIEPASVLLERIRAERAKNANRNAKPLPPVDTAELGELPEGWCWARAEELCDFITKGTTPAAHKLKSGSGEIPFIKVYNLTNRGILDFGVNPTFVSKETHSKELGRSRVFPGDVLMNIVGPPLGKVSIVPELFPEWNVNQAIAIYRPLTGYDRIFLCYCLLTNDILSWAINRTKATAGQSNLTLEICRDLPLPVPPALEQMKIVEEIERRLSVADEIEKTVDQSLKQAERLRQSILKRAFAGKLVPQDPTDEPAERLLERIKGLRIADDTQLSGSTRSNRKNASPP